MKVSKQKHALFFFKWLKLLHLKKGQYKCSRLKKGKKAKIIDDQQKEVFDNSVIYC